MDCPRYGSCVTDDLPPSLQNRVPRFGRRGRDAAGDTDMEALIHHVEKEAYCSVLRAFKAQSDTVSWEKESLMTELRKELRLCNEEHRELLRRVNADDVTRRIREMRQSIQPVHYPAASPSLYPLIGRKIRTRWPEDNTFYEAHITDYKPQEGLHALVYDIGTIRETWEWVNLSEIPPEDIIWDFPPSQMGIGGEGSDDSFQLLPMDTVIQEVERALMSSHHPDPLEIDRAKKMLQEQEQALTNAIARIVEISDHPESRGRGGGGSGHFFHGQSSLDQEWTTQRSSMET